MKLPPYLTFACRGFALLVPVLALMAYLWWTGTARSGDPSVTNALIDTCVAIERKTGRNGLACVGRVLVPCKADPDNAHKEDQMECDEREFVLWNRLMVQELRALRAKLSEEKKAKLRETQGLWDKFHTANCRLPYALFEGDKADFAGPACSIDLLAARAIQLRDWREALTDKVTEKK